MGMNSFIVCCGLLLLNIVRLGGWLILLTFNSNSIARVLFSPLPMACRSAAVPSCLSLTAAAFCAEAAAPVAFLPGAESQAWLEASRLVWLPALELA